MLRSTIDLSDARAAALRIELPIRKISPEHQQDVAVEHRVVARRESDQPGHADVVGIVPLDVLLAAHRMHHRRLQPFAERQELIVRSGASGAAQQGHAAVAVEHRRQPVEIVIRRDHDRLGWQQAGELGRRRIGGRLQGDIARDHHHRHAALAHGLANRHLQRARHLIGARDKLAVMAAFLEQHFRMGFLEISGADLAPREFARLSPAPGRASDGNRKDR